jgi:thiamine kinase-like enzyme
MLKQAMNTARTEAERSLEASLGKIEDWQGLTITYQRVDAGLTNFNFLVHVAELNKKYFAKVVGPNTEVFINRRVAHEAAVLSGNCGVGPVIAQYVAEDDFEVYDFLTGFRNCTVTDMLDPETSKRVMQAYAKIHAGAPLSATKTGFEQIREHARQAREAAADSPHDLEDLLARMARAEEALVGSDMALVPCFNDCYVTNYMVNDNKELRIVDWEYGANNDPYWDLASYFFESFADADTRRRLLKAYKPDAGAREEARVILYSPLVCLKWGLWASLQASISSIEFDFLKYADILFMRARYLMGQDAWSRALVSV